MTTRVFPAVKIPAVKIPNVPAVKIPNVFSRQANPVEVRCRYCGTIVVGIHESICRMRDDDEPITHGSYR